MNLFEPQEGKLFDDEEICAGIPQRAALGHIYKMGEHRLMCGDSANRSQVKALMGEELADMVFTDPPYDVAIGSKNKTLNELVPSNRVGENISNDNIPIKDLYSLLIKAMTNARLSCKDDAVYYVTSPIGGELGLMMQNMMKDAGLPVKHILIWRKNVATFSFGRLDYNYQHEPIFFTWTKKHHNYRKGKYRTTIWDFDKPMKSDLHPTMKPIGLVENAIMDGTVRGDIVLDVFGGSGTTLLASEITGRKCRMMEIDPHYCDVIMWRWERLTGEQAVKI